MMTPVYNVAIAYWRTNSYSVNHYAVRLDLSVFLATLSPAKKIPLPRKTDLFTFLVHSVNKYRLRCFHFICAEKAKYSQHMQQPTSNNFLLPDTSSKYDDSRNKLIHRYYSSEVHSPSYFNSENSGTDALWQQEKFKLKIRKSVNNELRSYIKEQPAGNTTTATDKEK